MTNRFMISVAAAALIAGSGFAFAQGAGGAGSGGGAAVAAVRPAAQQSAAGRRRRRRTAIPARRRPRTDEQDAPKRQSKDGMSKDGTNTAQSKDGMSKDGMKDSAQSKEGTSGQHRGRPNRARPPTPSPGTAAEDQVGQPRTDVKSRTAADTKRTPSRHQTTTGNAATSATAAPPAEKRTQIIDRHSLGDEHQGNHQRQLQYLGWHAGSELGHLLSAAAADRRDLSGMARLSGHPGWRSLRHRPAPDPRDRLHHRGLNGWINPTTSGVWGGQKCPPLSLESMATLSKEPAGRNPPLQILVNE